MNWQTVSIQDTIMIGIQIWCKSVTLGASQQVESGLRRKDLSILVQWNNVYLTRVLACFGDRMKQVLNTAIHGVSQMEESSTGI